uniref:Ras-associating domain-containing protein n=1 Tax=Steinernema glaseri TaxID=37863 RepID=A0A1I7YK33_9BILA
MLARTELALFFINEFTLSDVRCLLTLQFAWELHLPILMIRPPRTKLVICEGSSSKTVTPKSTEMGALINTEKKVPPSAPSVATNQNPLRPDYELLQEILYHGYQISLSYDRLDHVSSMARLKNRISRLLPPLPGANDAESLASLSVSNNATPSPQPPRGRPPHGGSGGKRAQRSPHMPQKDASNMRASKSMVNLSNGAGSRLPAANGIADLLPQVNRQLSQKSTASSRSERRSSVSSLDDTSNYNATQYLVFSVKDRTQKPILIQFPNDVIFNYDAGRFQNADAAEYLEKDVWGSDTSLEEEAEIAPSILGRFEERDLTAHIATHQPESDLDEELAPYNKPL